MTNMTKRPRAAELREVKGELEDYKWLYSVCCGRRAIAEATLADALELLRPFAQTLERVPMEGLEPIHLWHDDGRRLNVMLAENFRAARRFYAEQIGEGAVVTGEIEKEVQSRVEHWRSSVERLHEENDQLRNVLSLILPLAKGYVAANDVGSNREYIAHAEVLLDAGKSGTPQQNCEEQS